MPAFGVRTSLLVICLLLPACGAPHYPLARPPTFQTRAPREVAFEALVQRAAQLGYVHLNVDPRSATFAVYAHAYGPPRGVRRARRRRRSARSEVIRSDLLIVEVGDGEVRVRPFGPHVVGGDHVDPLLATEMRDFARALRETTRALHTGGLASVVHGAVPPPGPQRDRALASPPPATSAPRGAATSLSAP